MSEIKSISVMIVDDHPVVRTGLKTMLQVFDDLMFIGEAASGPQTLAECEQTLPDVILMDMLMPGMNGVATTRAVLARYPGVKIIVLTSFAEEEMVQDALEAGAIGYLLKNAPIDKLAEAIRSAYSGKPTLAPEATRALINAKTGPLKLGRDLTPRERDVLALVVEGLSNEEIAAQLTISPATARHHVSACIKKLGASNRTQAAARAVEYQLI
jgi:NarL family two-component system response regulator LiaR